MKVIARCCADKFRYYVVFHKSILFILGLIFGFKLVEILIFNILITYLIPPSMKYDLRKVAILANLQGGISSVLAIFLAFVADAYLGLFKMVISASTLCIAGGLFYENWGVTLVLIHFSLTSKDEIVYRGMFSAALVVLTLSEAATMVTLNLFLGDQLAAAMDQPLTLQLEEKRSELRIKFWSCIVYTCASIFALFGPLKNFWLTDLARVLAIVMGAALFCFLLGFKFYNRAEPAGSALTDVPAVICNAIIKRNVAYPQRHEQISPHVSWLRWVDRATLVQEDRVGGRNFSVEQVKGVKSLLKMLPIWSTFITFSVVSASGYTFFLEEAYSITHSHLFPILFLFKLWTFTANIVSHRSRHVVEKLSEKKNYNAQKMMLVRIGIGMVCCVLCCVAGWTQAVHRLYLVKIHGYDQVKHYTSVYRLTPQFLLLGFMEGLALDGLQIFFESQVSPSMSRYGQLLGEFVMGSGSFVSIAFILIFSKCFAWFGSDVKTSRLDDFYVVLGGLSCVNLIVYCLVALWYQDNSPLQTESSSPTCCHH